MSVHITARVAWHDDGWNGHICRKPSANTYCVGPRSYPGQLIAELRSLEWEETVCGQSTGNLDRIPPCCYSMNAFGADEIPAESAPPVWFGSGAQTRRWTLPPATVCVWPYEEMYADEVSTPQGSFDYKKRLDRALEFFSRIQPDKSLIFYYANYSNPFSEDQAPRYVLVGMSRVKSVGEQLFYENCSEDIIRRYAGGYVWQRAITSWYPDQGLRIPYHLYRDKPEILKRLALYPESPRLCTYATRQFNDDDALSFVEGFLRIVGELQDIGDHTENWEERARWLESLIAELWHNRGLYPGMPAVLEVLRFEHAIPYFRQQALQGRELDAAHEIFACIEGKIDSIEGLSLDAATISGIRRQWRLRTAEEQRLLRDVLPRFNLQKDQIQNILGERRSQNGISATLAAIAENPYILSEQYSGEGPDDVITWGTIDRGMIPSPELGAQALASPDDPRRLRALLVQHLKREDSHVFLPADAVLEAVNRSLAMQAEWKRWTFHERYLNADEEFLAQALVMRQVDGQRYLYLKEAYEDERLIEEKIRFLISGPDIELRVPMTEDVWQGFLYTQAIADKAPQEYHAALAGQMEACRRLFVRPLSVLAGEAGTGKTTVIRALIKAIKRCHGTGSPVIALAPTGKAADRIREIVEQDDSIKDKVEVTTIHSFLAKHGWLNPNMTFKRTGGQIESKYATYIIDESSMLELELTATLFRAIQWPSVQRFILVGDPNQLPPIGRGRLFADIIEYVQQHAPESFARLEHNLRQLIGRVSGGATGIIDLARCYIHQSGDDAVQEARKLDAEQMLQQIHAGGDITPDLRVLYWHSQQELVSLLLEYMKRDLAEDAGLADQQAGIELGEAWWQAHQKNSRPSLFQILSPYRGEYFGVEELNRICQEHVLGQKPDGMHDLNGIMLYDKVIQIRNRPQSSPIWSYNHENRQSEKIEIFNGQLGFVWPHPFDRQKNKYHNNAWLKRFAVTFDRRQRYSVGFGRELGRDERGHIINENVEENLELAYAISVHKAQGSEFERVYVVIPKKKRELLSMEMFYTALTRAKRHCTLLIEQDISPLLGMRRLEASRLRRINASLFSFHAVPRELLSINGWYEDGKIHQTLAAAVVRSKSEVIIANMLFDRGIPFQYEQPLYAPDGTSYLPDFTITWRGTQYYWEHVGMLDKENYRVGWERKQAWYERFFTGRLITTFEGSDLSLQARDIIECYFT